MSTANSERPLATYWLWAALAAVVPLPYWVMESGRETIVQLVVFSFATGAVALTEPTGITAFVAGLFLAQTLLYAWLLRRIAQMLLQRVGSTLVLAIAVLVLIGVCATVAVYRTPFSTTGMTATLLDLYR